VGGFEILGNPIDWTARSVLSAEVADDSD
jgi:hypothetical protein